MDGFDASEKIIEHDSNIATMQNKCEIVALTAYHSEETVQRCHNIGMKAVYNKPACYDDVKQILYKYHFNLSPTQCLILDKLDVLNKEKINQQKVLSLCNNNIVI